MSAIRGRTIEFNKVFEPAFYTKKRYVILCGGSNAGKSYFDQQLLMSRFMAIPGYNILCIRKVYESIGGSIFHLFQKIIRQWGIQSRVHETKYMIENLRNGNLIQFGGLNDEKQREKTKSITAPNGNIEAIFAEEFTQLTEFDFKELDRRMRGKSETGIPKQFFGSFNPVIETHWIRRHFQIDLQMESYYTARKDVYLQRVTIDDNRWSTKEDWKVLERYREEGDEYSYMVYRFGIWGALDQENVVIPYSLFYKAKDNKVEPEGDYKVGCDPARFGDDDAVIYYGRGYKVLDQKVFKKSDSYMLADAICAMDEKWRMKEWKREVKENEDAAIPKLEIKVDAGEGSGVIDILIKRKLPNASVHQVNNGGKPKNPKLYDNVATESWFEFRDAIELMEFIPRDDKMKSQCSGRLYVFKELRGVTGQSKTVKSIEPKAQYKKRHKELNGESPNKGDAIVLFNYDPPQGPAFFLGLGGGK